MSPESWPLVVAVTVLVPEVVDLVAKLLQRSRIGSPVPAELTGIYDPGEYETSNRYTRAKANVGLLKDAFDLGVFYAFWFLHGFPWLDSFCTSLGFQSEVVTGLIFFGIIGLASSLLDLPWAVYRTFVLEESFGFNKTTLATFIKDILKVVALSVALGGPLLAVVLWFFITVGPYAWLVVWAVLTTFQLVLFFLMPVLILPLFFKLIPLPEGTAIVTTKTGKDFPEFLSTRLFYSREPFAAKPCWRTLDSRFAGAQQGSTLSIAWCEDRSCWAICEGEPSGQVLPPVLYAMCAGDVAGACKLAEGPQWTLTTEARAAVKESAENGRAARASVADPLVMEGLRSTCVDVGALRRKLFTLAERLGYHGASIFVIDGSARSEHSNAFCTGFGRFRRICLFDTLLPLMEEEEIVAVLGHEIGHDRLYHVHTTLCVSLVYSLLMLAVLGQFLTSTAISRAFFVAEPKVYVGIVLFSVIWSVVEFVVQIPMTMMSRSNEFSADRYAVDADPSYAALLTTALTKLSKKSKSNLTPHPFYAFLKYSHPPLDTRFAAIRAYHAARYGTGRN